MTHLPRKGWWNCSAVGLTYSQAAMDHCIYCGTSNPAGATFCLACGQTLYHEPRPPAAVSARKTIRRWLASVGVLTGSVALILLVLFAIHLGKRPSDTVSNRQDIAQSTAAVLTIIGYDNAGNREAQGSGFILTGEGLGATNYHVLEGAQRAIAECCNGRKFEIKSVEGADPDKDIVVFQLQEQGASETPSGLPSVALDTTGNISVGEKVIAIGSPQGLENTVSDGIISAIRSDKSVRYLQITAPISPGSSGGPVLNGDGRVIGIATMQMREGQNLNFAVSTEYLQPLLSQHLQSSLDELRSSEQLERAATGRATSDVDKGNNQKIWAHLQSNSRVRCITIQQIFPLGSPFLYWMHKATFAAVWLFFVRWEVAVPSSGLLRVLK
jgi:S1-C subfamily serine protease